LWIEHMFGYAAIMTPSAALGKATAVASGAADLAQVAWDEVADNDAVELALVIGRTRALLDAALLGVAGRLEETGAAAALGWSSTKDFLTHVTGGHRGTGGGLVRAVEQMRDLPAVRAALETGAITLPQARVIAGRVTTLPRVPDLRRAAADRMLQLVAERGYDATDLQNAFGDVVRELDPDGSLRREERAREKKERASHQSRFLSVVPDGLGGVDVRGHGTLEDGERIQSVLAPLSAPVTTEPGACGGEARRIDDPLLDEHGHYAGARCPTPGCAHDGRDPRDHGKRMWDALVDACDRLRATETLPRDHGATPRVVVLIDHASLRQQVIDAGLARDGELHSDERVSAHAVRRLACDAEILPAVLGSDGQVLDVGRTHRLVTPAIWLALVLRDRHCVFPGCTRPPLACDAHHVVHWADGGPTSLDNMVMLCRQHHVLTHQTPWTLHMDTATGRPVWTPPPPRDLRDRITYHPARRPPGHAPPKVA
jgi:hypothetical protein